MPIAFPMLLKSSIDWDLYGEMEPGLGNRRLYLPRGKVIGGSGSINAMIYVRGNRADYDGWAAGGAEGWSYDDVLPYFRRSEDNERGEDPFHGAGGPLSVVRQPRDEPADRDDASKRAGSRGTSVNPDFNGARRRASDVSSSHSATACGARRQMAFLHPAEERPNLDVITDAMALRIVFDGARAVASRSRGAARSRRSAPTAT